MGEILSKPVTETDSSTGGSSMIIYGQSSMQGYRIAMEDAHSAMPFLNGSDDDSIAYFGIFDGHNGSLVSKACSERLHNVLISLPSYKEGDYKTALIEAFVSLDESFIKEKVHDGSAALVILITNNKMIYVANAGDCRAVLSLQSGKAIPLSEDHKPNLPREVDRIRKAGSIVSYTSPDDPRLNGVFSLSRSFGDIDHKRNDLPPHERAMSAYPDILFRKLSDADEFVLIACDGIWAVMENEEVISLARSKLSKKMPLDKVCEAVMHQCLEKKSLDNMSVIIVALLYGKSKEEWYKRFEPVSNESDIIQDHQFVSISRDEALNGSDKSTFRE